MDEAMKALEKSCPDLARSLKVRRGAPTRENVFMTPENKERMRKRKLRIMREHNVKMSEYNTKKQRQSTWVEDLEFLFTEIDRLTTLMDDAGVVDPLTEES